MTNTTYIGVGSNLGDRQKNCDDAVRHISKLPDTSVTAISKWYPNPALTAHPDERQPDFVNGVIKIETKIPPHKLLKELIKIEIAMGREPNHTKWVPRTIDLDILLYGNETIKSSNLTIPHPGLHKRIFVLKPLCDIDPTLSHPILKLAVSQLLNKLL